MSYNETRPVTASGLERGATVTGDELRPARFGTGTAVLEVERIPGWVIVRTDTNGDMMFHPWATLYVAVEPARPVAPVPARRAVLATV